MFSKILRKFGIFTTILTSSILTSCSPTIIQKQEKVNQKIVDFQLDNGEEDEELELEESENRLQSKTKKSMASDSLSSNSVWFDTKNIWTRIKNWWNSWGEPLFIGLFWLSGVAGIGIASYNIHLSNKRNFKLQTGEKLKVTLEFQPESGKSGGTWYGLFYNNGSSLDACCSCQRRFKSNNNNQQTDSSNKPVSISYYLVSGPSKPGVLLYNLEGEGSECNKGTDKYATKLITFKDYYPGSNTIDVYGYQGKEVNKTLKLGKLTVTRKLIKCNAEDKEDEVCKCYKNDANSNECKCICECKKPMSSSSTTSEANNSSCECKKVCTNNNSQTPNSSTPCCCCALVEKPKDATYNCNNTQNSTS